MTSNHPARRTKSHDGFVVVVTFSVKAEFRTEFRAAVTENAATSLALEPDCSLFQVAENHDGTEVFLYEVYGDETAFKSHLAAEHFRRFDDLVGPWVADKRVATYHRLPNPDGTEG